MARTRDSATAADDEAHPDTVLATWGFTVASTAPTLVVPDGCRDLILHRPARGRPVRWFVTDLDRGPRAVRAHIGDGFTGYRLLPGTVVDVAELLAALDGCDGTDPGAVLDRLDYHVALAPDVEETLALLAAGSAVERTARDLSWSVSRIQRRLRAATGWPPSTWRSLARARRAARACASSADGDPRALAEIAAEHGFSDQPHLSREIRRWFATTPGALRAGASALPQLWASGYGDGSGVQSSMRNPSTSRT